MFFDWQDVVAIWLTYGGGIWPVALIIIVMVCVKLSLNKMKMPSDPVLRKNYTDNIRNERLDKTGLRRFAEATRMLVITFIISISFLIVVYKIFI